MGWKRTAKSLISYPGRWARGEFWWERLFHFYNGTDGDLCLLCEVCGVPRTPPPPPKRKDLFFFTKVWLCRPSSYLERMMLQSPLMSPLDPVFFTGPQTESCKSIKSSERSTGFGCDNDLQKTTNGERTRLTHSHKHTQTYHPHLSSPSSLCNLHTHLVPNPPTYCVSCRLRWQRSS